MQKPSDSSPDSVFALADRFFKAIEECDVQSLREIYAENAVIWHNYDPLDAREEGLGGKVVTQNIALLQAVPKLIANIKYEVWFREKTESGFVQQHVVTGNTHDGEKVRFPVCVICRVRDGRIEALYEYLDIQHLPAAVIRYFSEAAGKSS